MLSLTAFQTIAAALFALAVTHTFCTGYFTQLSHRFPKHAGLLHLLGEVEVVFGLWAMVLIALLMASVGPREAKAYLTSRDFTEPMFVFAMMVVAGSRPVLELAATLVRALEKRIALPGALPTYFVLLGLVPILGSLITEPAAMTLAALLLSQHFFPLTSLKLKYATIALLFVNISIGGTLTPFAAPPVLMVADTWNWDLRHMFTQFGWKACAAVFVNNVATMIVFRRELAALRVPAPTATRPPVPLGLQLAHVALLIAIVATNHTPPAFLGLLMLFLGVAAAYPQFQDRLLLREALLVAFFLAGLVVLGGKQTWWLQPALTSMSAEHVFFAAAALTAITDNAAITYLASLVPGLSDAFKYYIVAGAVAGGGLTVIANAPNPVGNAILREYFPENNVRPLKLLLAALPPTVVAMLAFRFL
jgi:hypothetical protein